MIKQKFGFTLAEVLIVIGIIGVVAALTLPNLNHATGDKETVTRLQKAYSILNEANDRAVAIYGPISSWPEECRDNFIVCWMNRVGEFLKINKSCSEYEGSIYGSTSCDSLAKGIAPTVIYQLPDGMTFAPDDIYEACDQSDYTYQGTEINDICISQLYVDINGPNKGKNEVDKDIFIFTVSNNLGIQPYMHQEYDLESALVSCFGEYGKSNQSDSFCTFWVMEFGNLDYLKADTSGKCNNSNIILDGTTNTSCH